MSPLSVIVCTFRRHALVPRVLAHLAGQTVAPGEVLVVDNEGAPAVEALVARAAASASFPVRYLAEAKPGLSHARNRGVAEAKGSLLAFLDDDAFVEASWADALVRGAARHPEGGVFAGAVEPITEGEVPPGLLEEVGGHAVWLGALDLGVEDRRMRAEGAAYAGPVGANMMFRREALERAGPFDPQLGRVGEKLVSGEEVVVVNAARAAGFEVWYLGRARAQHLVHRDRLTPRWFLQRAFFEGLSIGRALKAQPGGDAEALARSAAEQASQLCLVLDRGGRTLAPFPLRTRIELAKILGRVSETARAGAALSALREHRELLELELPEEGVALFR